MTITDPEFEYGTFRHWRRRSVRDDKSAVLMERRDVFRSFRRIIDALPTQHLTKHAAPDSPVEKDLIIAFALRTGTFYEKIVVPNVALVFWKNGRHALLHNKHLFEWPNVWNDNEAS